MKKYIANIVTSIRITVSVVMIFLSVSSFLFRVSYILCGITDMIDGEIARKTKSESKFGAKLDTVADLTFFAVASIKILPDLHIPLWIVMWAAAIAIIKIVNVISVLYFRIPLELMHTTMNRITGFMLFVLVFFVRFIDKWFVYALVCLMGTCASVGEYTALKKYK